MIIFVLRVALSMYSSSLPPPLQHLDLKYYIKIHLQDSSTFYLKKMANKMTILEKVS